MQLPLAALIFAATLTAQPRFEVVSIREVPRDAPPTMRDIHFTPVLPGGQYVDQRANLWSMVAFAYDVKDASFLLHGLPKWAADRSYAVAAKPASGFSALSAADNQEQVRLMLRAMLADRFHLKIHKETREEDVLLLEVAKGGVQMKKVDPPEPPARETPVGLALGDADGRMIGNKSTVRGIIGAVTVWLKRPIVDRTGLAGYYDFDIRWRSPDAGASPSLGAAGIALLVSAMDNQLGLHLRKGTGPVDHWIVDGVEPPTEN